MSETITGLVSAGGQKSTVAIVISGRASPECLDELRTLLKMWAKRCGLKVGSLMVTRKSKKKKKK